MQIFLQHKTTRGLFQATDRWTPLQDQACNFGTFEKAVIFAQEQHMTDVHVLMVFIRTGQTFLLPLPAPDEIQADSTPSP
jgi:hypothetical protein